MRAALLALALLGFPAAGQEAGPKVDFVRDIQPVFKASCAKCHGPEKPKGQFRMDSRTLFMKGGVSGKAVVPGNSKESLLVKLLLSGDDEERMPQKAPALPKAQIDLVRAWIDQGAPWPDSAAGEGKVEVHWAYQKPVRRDPPAVRDSAASTPLGASASTPLGASASTPLGASASTPLGASWVRNPIDAFVLARLEKEGIRPSPEADRPTLIKRLSYDLVGLPPEPAEVDAFAADRSPDAWEKLVDRLLASPHFGERWGRHWLDKARYADSDGYEKDNSRPDAWRFRSWVIDALNADLPFDRFTIEQLAGDLLPDAGPMQHLATAFHRQTLTNTEGGTDKEQFRVEAVFDRTETTAAVWLGLTVGCARCHNHKYDAISQQEYYQLFAFFNNGDETTTEIPISDEAVAAHQKEKAAHERKLRALRGKLDELKPRLAEGLAAWEAGTQGKLQADLTEAFRFHPAEIVLVKPAAEVTFKKLDDGSVLAGGADPEQESYVVTAKAGQTELSGFRIEVLADPSLPAGGPGRAANGNFVLSEFRVETAAGAPVALQQPEADFSQKDWPVKAAIDGDPKTGWAVQPQSGKNHQASFRTKEPLRVGPDDALRFTLDQKYGEKHTIGRFRLFVMTGTRPGLDLPEDVRRILATKPERRTPAELERLLEHYAGIDPLTEKLVKEIEEHRKAEPKAPVLSIRVISQRRDPRKTTIFRRGEFLQPLQEVQAGTLASLHPFKARGPGAPDRLDLARWLVDPANPVTARMAVNHVWSALFGHGLVRTANDFGVRGERPSHPELLDWLATEYPKRLWSLKSMIRLITSSSTYRQASRHRPELLEKDPQNLLLHRQNRFRVEAEIVRDLALAASGLLSRKIGGPSVFPPMPPDVAALSYANNFKWNTSKGEDRHRRGLYTYFKRTAPHPNMTTFDCPDSNTTCVQRRASNTPLQALTALNNETFAEAAVALAKRAMAAEGNDRAKLAGAFRVCVARAPESGELERLLDLLETGRAWYRTRPGEGKKLAGDPETAAWTAAARILLNLDEFITRE